jgi:hypothetical protein
LWRALNAATIVNSALRGMLEDVHESNATRWRYFDWRRPGWRLSSLTNTRARRSCIEGASLAPGAPVSPVPGQSS